MGNFVHEDTIIARGAILHWLGQISVGAQAREQLGQLSAAIKKLAPTYEGLETAFDTHLAAPLHVDATTRKKIADYLKKNWFNDSPGAYFPGQKVTQQYGQAVLKTLELSLNGKPNPIPINAWWMIQSDPAVRMLNLAEVDRDGATVSGGVSFLILTPRPSTSGAPSTVSIWGDAQAWLTEQQGAVVTRQIENEAKPKR
jgi:hypothetical protein